MFVMHYFKISRSSEDKRHKGGEGRQEARAEQGAKVDE